ncbi:MAG: DUF1476 domain-containing protein [Rhodospirillales bacterium]|nr:DUF1476 domain-containing protein [Rhodospirillales bacterium]
MANIFRDREKAQEAKYKLDEELRFRAESRRNRLLGEWLADKFGLTGEAKKAYAAEVVQSDLETAGIEDVISKVMNDVKARGANVAEKEVRDRLNSLYAVAFEQVRNEYPKALGPDHDKVGD